MNGPLAAMPAHAGALGLGAGDAGCWGRGKGSKAGGRDRGGQARGKRWLSRAESAKSQRITCGNRPNAHCR
eukprot:364935-Chlamydomonas_euryale.AAC.12